MFGASSELAPNIELASVMEFGFYGLRTRASHYNGDRKCETGKMRDSPKWRGIRLENAGAQNAGPICEGGKCGTIEYGKLVCE